MEKSKIEKIQLKGESIYLKKGFMGWNVVAPYKNEDGSINWFNLLTGGSWWRLVFAIILVMVIVGAIIEYTSNINILVNCFNDPVSLEVCKKSFGYQEIIFQ